MIITFYVDKRAAIIEGREDYGWVRIELLAGDLSISDRETLLAVDNCTSSPLAQMFITKGDFVLGSRLNLGAGHNLPEYSEATKSNVLARLSAIRDILSQIGADWRGGYLSYEETPVCPFRAAISRRLVPLAKG